MRESVPRWSRTAVLGKASGWVSNGFYFLPLVPVSRNQGNSVFPKGTLPDARFPPAENPGHADSLCLGHMWGQNGNEGSLKEEKMRPGSGQEEEGRSGRGLQQVLQLWPHSAITHPRNAQQCCAELLNHNDTKQSTWGTTIPTA